MSYLRQLFLGGIVRLLITTSFGLFFIVPGVFIYWQLDIVTLANSKAVAAALMGIVATLGLGLYKLFSDNLKLRETQFETRTKTLEDKHEKQERNVNIRAEAIEEALKEQTEKLTHTIVTSMEALRQEHKELGAIVTLQATTDRELNNQRHHNNIRCELAIFKAVKKISPDANLDEEMLLLPPLPPTPIEGK